MGGIPLVNPSHQQQQQLAQQMFLGNNNNLMGNNNIPQIGLPPQGQPTAQAPFPGLGMNVNTTDVVQMFLMQQQLLQQLLLQQQPQQQPLGLRKIFFSLKILLIIGF
jgi:hypothetical protein